MSTYTLQYPECSRALYHALDNDAFYRTLESTIEVGDPMHGMLKYLDYSIEEGRKYGTILMPTDDPYGVSVWSKPLPAQEQQQCSREKKAFLLNNLGSQSLDTYTAIVEFMSAQTTSLVDKSAWYLSILGISPERQGQGLGRQLVAPILEQADHVGVQTYLETFTPRNKSFYQRLGFREAGVFYEPTAKAEYAVMVRDKTGV